MIYRLPPQLTERYAPERQLGAGGMGSVWLCREKPNGKRVAVKVIHDDTEADLRKRFEWEARAMRTLDHPNVAKILEADFSGSDAFIVMEHLEGETLDLALPLDPFPPILDAASGLEACHAAQFVHRDVKLTNIMLTEDGRTVLIDFGLAYYPGRTRITAQGAVLGTVGYMAPEVIRGEHPTPAVDWYSLGVCLYFLFEARMPFSLLEVMALSRGDPLSPLPFEWITPGSPEARLLAFMLAEDPAVRPANRARMEEILREPSEVMPRRKPSTRLTAQIHATYQSHSSLPAQPAPVKAGPPMEATSPQSAVSAEADDQAGADTSTWRRRAVLVTGFLLLALAAAGVPSVALRTSPPPPASPTPHEGPDASPPPDSRVPAPGSTPTPTPRPDTGTVTVGGGNGDPSPPERPGPRVIRHPHGRIRGLLPSPEADHLLVTGEAGLSCWSLQSGERHFAAETTNFPTAAFTPDGDRLVAWEPGVGLTLRRVNGGAVLARVESEDRAERILELTPGGDRVALVMDLQGRDHLRLFAIENGSALRQLASRALAGVVALAFTPSGERLAVHTGRPWSVQVCDAHSLAREDSFRVPLPFDRIWIPPGEDRLVTLLGSSSFDTWDLARGTLLDHHDLRTADPWPRRFHTLPGGGRLRLAVQEEHQLAIYEYPPFRVLRAAASYDVPGLLTAAAFRVLPGGGRVLVASSDGEVHVIPQPPGPGG